MGCDRCCKNTIRKMNMEENVGQLYQKECKSNQNTFLYRVEVRGMGDKLGELAENKLPIVRKYDSVHFCVNLHTISADHRTFAPPTSISSPPIVCWIHSTPGMGLGGNGSRVLTFITPQRDHCGWYPGPDPLDGVEVPRS